MVELGLRACIQEDAMCLTAGRSGLRHAIRLFATVPGFRATVIYRLQQAAWSRSRPLAYILSQLNATMTGAEFVPGCEIGPRLVVRHPNGLVVGAGVRIGTDSVLFQGVTLGRRRLSGDDKRDYPCLGHRVTVGANAVIIGGVTVGDDVLVGALSLVNRDVPAGETVAGNPARRLR